MNVPDFTEAEKEVVDAELFKRYGKQVDMQPADSELQLDPASDAHPLPYDLLDRA